MRKFLLVSALVLGFIQLPVFAASGCQSLANTNWRGGVSMANGVFQNFLVSIQNVEKTAPPNGYTVTGSVTLLNTNQTVNFHAGICQEYSNGYIKSLNIKTPLLALNPKTQQFDYSQNPNLIQNVSGNILIAGNMTSFINGQMGKQ